MNLAIIKGKTEFLYANSRSLMILAKFLIDDIGFGKIDSIINWINNDTYKSVVLNASYLVKNNDKINIYFFYDEYGKEENKKRERFAISKNNLIEIIKTWKYNHIEGPPSDVIIKNEGEITKIEIVPWFK